MNNPIKLIGCEDWLNVYEKSAKWDIAQSTFASFTMDELMALDGEEGASFYESLNREVMNYGWIEGSPEFKDEVAKLYRKPVSPSRILQTNGCTGANLNAMHVLIEPGDHVVAEWPTYTPLYEVPRQLGAEVDYWELEEGLGWKPDVEKLKRLVKPNTKLICINNASNPVGCVLDKDTLEQIADIARSVGAYVLSDEVYMPMDDTENYWSMADVYEKAIVTNSVSKTYSTPGARIGWVVADEEVAQRVRVYRDYSMICTGVFNDILATYVLKNRQTILERNRRICHTNHDIVAEWVKDQPRAKWNDPKGVSVSYLQLDIPESDEEFCKRILSERGVLLVPGTRFELPNGARLGYCCHEDVLRKGLALLGEALAEYDK
ncbi:aminotransferase [Parafannyhessea umbonata]|uniref:aminotransferase n=1 Tax=Parafannyhessea umbonata TaxID=604330 RepID=UPI003AB2B831